MIVDLGECEVAWTADVTAPSGVPAVAPGANLVYAYTKRHSWLGVNPWYLTALDLRTGRTAFAVRTGLGVLRDNHHGAVTLGPHASAYVRCSAAWSGSATATDASLRRLGPLLVLTASSADLRAGQYEREPDRPDVVRVLEHPAQRLGKGHVG